MPSRKVAVEHQGLSLPGWRVQRYLGATRGADLWKDSPLLPPTISAIWETALVLELLASDGLPFPKRGLVHLGGELVVVRPLRRDDRVRCRVELDGLEGHARGLVLQLRCRSWSAAGQLAQENRTSLLVCGAEAPSGTPRGARSAAQERKGVGEPVEAAWREIAAWDLPARAGLTYARASGDFNPIHLWPWSARMFGFQRPILHGHCALAMVAHELVRATGRETRRLQARFRAPLELPARVELQIPAVEVSGAIPLRLVDARGPGKPFLEGEWVGADRSAC